MRPGTTFGSACVLAAALLWGTTGTAAALAPEVGSLAIGAAAMGIGGLLQAAAAIRVIHMHRAKLCAQRGTLMLAAAAVAIYPLAFYSSMRLAGVAAGTVVSVGSGPMAAAFIERFADHRKLSSRWAVGAVVGVTGVLTLAISRASEGELTTGPDHAYALAGVALGLLAGLTYALYSWCAARMMRRDLPTRPVMGSIFGIGGILLLPVLMLTGAPIVASSHNLAVAGYLAGIPMFLGYLLFGKGLSGVTASTATTLSLIEPAAASLIAVTVLNERLPALGWLGMALLLGSLIVTTIDARQHSDVEPLTRPARHDQSAKTPM